MSSTELDLIMCGLPNYDVADWQKHTSYPGPVKHTATIQFFWELLHEYDNETRAKVLRFTTGPCSPPPSPTSQGAALLLWLSFNQPSVAWSVGGPVGILPALPPPPPPPPTRPRATAGSAGVPVEGFKGLRGRLSAGTAGTEAFKIASTRPVPSCGKRQCIGQRACICRLPQSHTCYNTLDLPPYPTKAILREKLEMAIAGSEGFDVA